MNGTTPCVGSPAPVSLMDEHPSAAARWAQPEANDSDTDSDKLATQLATHRRGSDEPVQLLDRECP